MAHASPQRCPPIRGKASAIPPVIWLTSLALTILGLDCYQNGEAPRVFLLGALILLFVHGVLFLVARFLPLRTAQKRSEIGKLISYSVVLLGAAWVAVRILDGGLIHFSSAYLDAFVLGGLSGCLHFMKKRELVD